MTRNILLSALIVAALTLIGILLFDINKGQTTFTFAQQFGSEQYVCDGEFEIPITIKNPLTTAETVALQLRDSRNIQNGRLSTAQISLDGGGETTVEVFGKLADGCRDGTVNILASGTRISGLFEVEAQAFGVKGSGPAGRTPDNNGFFDYSNPNPSPVTLICCGVGFAGRYTVDFLPSENVNLVNLNAAPVQFECVGEETHTVNITGNLADLSKSAMVRARIKTPLDASCRVKTAIEAAR